MTQEEIILDLGIAVEQSYISSITINSQRYRLAPLEINTSTLSAYVYYGGNSGTITSLPYGVEQEFNISDITYIEISRRNPTRFSSTQRLEHQT